MLAIEYHVYILQWLLQLSCCNTCQIWMWFEESNMYFWLIANFAYGEINKGSFSNPYTWLGIHKKKTLSNFPTWMSYEMSVVDIWRKRIVL